MIILQENCSRKKNRLLFQKFQLPKRNLKKLYCRYMRPLLEYSAEVWAGLICQVITGLSKCSFAQLQGAQYFLHLDHETMKPVGKR